MNTTKTIRIELSDWNPRQQFGESAVVGDSGTRSLEFELTEGGRPWMIPVGVRAALAFRNAAGCSGEYDTMPDGRAAYSIRGNRIRMELVEQVTAAAGQTALMLVLRSEKMEQLSSFPFFVTVSEGIEGVEPLPREYYWVSSLGEINRELARLDGMLKVMDTETVLAAAREAKQAAEEARACADSVDADKVAAAIARKGDDVYIEDGRVYLLSGEEKLGVGAALPMGEGLAFDGGFVDEEGYLHLTLEGADIGGFQPFPVGGGGAGAASVLMLRSDHDLQFSILEGDESCVIPFVWRSTVDGEETGGGFAEWTVNGSRVALETVEQGECAFDVRPFLAAGAENDLVLKVTDAYGTKRTLRFCITVEAYSMSWNLGEMGVHDGALSVRMTPVGTGRKVLKLAVDGQVVSDTPVTTTGRTVTVVVPEQVHGAHTIEGWVEVPEAELRTEVLRHTGVWLSEGVSTPVVGVLNPQIGVSQYGTALIRWFVLNPAAENADVELKADGVSVNLLTNVGRGVQTWAYKSNVQGAHTLSIHCADAAATVDLFVADPGYELDPVTTGLELDLDPEGHSNAEADRGSFGYLDALGVNHPLSFSENFDWVNGGFREDEEGVTAFVIKRGCHVTLDRSIFGEDRSQSGLHMKLIFRANQVRNYDAQLMQCRSGNVGLTVQAHGVNVSSQLENMEILCCEGRKIEMDVCVQSRGEGSLAWIDLKGIQSCPPIRYGETDTWAQSDPVPLTIGSGEADVWVYRIKLWGNSLNRYEVLDEHIACAGSAWEMAQRYLRNDIYNTDGSINPGKVSKHNPELRVIQFRADRMTTGEEDQVTGDLELTYAAGGDRHQLVARGVTFRAQGASATEYMPAALSLDVDLGTADTCFNALGEKLTEYAMTDSSIPVSCFSLKANVASSEGCNNVCLADAYNRWNPYVCDPRRRDPRVRDTVEGHPCAVFFTSTADSAIEVGTRTLQPGETILYFVGDMTNAKNNFAVFGQDNGVYPRQCCVEVRNNTEKPCRFKEEIADDESWKDGNFAFRFPENPTDEMKAAFSAMQRWVVSTDRGAATGEAFAVGVELEGKVYAGDTAEYRAAKFRSQFADFFVPESMDFHYLFTDVNCMTENRAKNLFFCYEYVAELEDYRWSVRCDYDNDTALGTDSSGVLRFGYGLEDTDMVGESWVFHAHDSVLWSNIRDLRAEELKRLYARLAGQGAWDTELRSEEFREYQSAVCEALRAEDMHNKYFLPWLNQNVSVYGQWCLGTKEEQREQFLRYQEVYKASQYCDITNRVDTISMHVNADKTENGAVTITTYSDLYIVVLYGSGGKVCKRVKGNTPARIECPMASLGDTEVCIFAASSLTALSSLADMKPKYVMANTAKRLQELIIGSGEAGYRNRNLNQIGVAGNRMLRLLDLRGCSNLVTALDLTELTALERFLANGSGITGVSFARRCPLKEVRLPAVSALTALELKELERFTMDASALTLLRVEDCIGIDTLAICKGAQNLERGRLTGVDWTDTDAATLMRLTRLEGCDGQGKPVDGFVLTGKCHVDAITQLQLDAITAAFPELEVSFDSIVESVTVTFQSWDGTVLNTQVIPVGGSAVNPVTAGLIGEPERGSDVEHHYRYTGWDRGFADVQEDMLVTAVFTAFDRYYRVTHWVDKAESEICQEDVVIAHGEVECREEPQKEGAVWMGWDKATTDVVADLDVHAIHVIPRLPDSVPEKFDYLYSDDPLDDSALSIEEFLGVLEYGAEETFFRVGDRIRMLIPKNDLIPDSAIEMMVLGFRQFRLVGGTGFAGVVFGMVGALNTKHRMGTGSDGGWEAAQLRDWLNEAVFAALPLKWQRLLKTVQVRSLAGSGTDQIVTSEDKLFLLSAGEVGLRPEDYPYHLEIDPEAARTVLDAFPDNPSRIRKTYNGLGTACEWWLRTPNGDADGQFLLVGTDGGGSANTESMYATYNNGVSFACCMGGMEG